MKRILLHVCCGPCASACVPALKGAGEDVALLFANSNIDTHEEFEKRLREAEKLASADGVPIAVLPYDHEEWLHEVAAGYEYEPEKGERCARCFRYNLKKAAEYAKAHGFDSFTTSLTVSPHKVSSMVFAAGADAEKAAGAPRFATWDFKKGGGFAVSTRRAAELGLYRQSYCGCEFSKAHWRIHHKRETESTNLDARSGNSWDVFTADYQTAGRGRLDHKWLSPPGANLLMSAVLPVEGLSPEQVSTLPLVAGLAVAKSLPPFFKGFSGSVPMIKWPNDILIGRKKVAGILCERDNDKVIVGIGINVEKQDFSPELQDKAISLGSVPSFSGSVPKVQSAVLGQLGRWYGVWRDKGFGAVHREIAALDFLRGQTLSVLQTDNDATPISGICGGIRLDGSLDVGGVKVYAGEAHVIG